jgi:hypothetical protein
MSRYSTPFSVRTRLSPSTPHRGTVASIETAESASVVAARTAEFPPLIERDPAALLLDQREQLAPAVVVAELIGLKENKDPVDLVLHAVELPLDQRCSG